MKLEGNKSTLQRILVMLTLLWVFTGNVQAQFVEVGQVVRQGDNCYQMTDTVNANGNSDTSAIWWAQPINLDNGFDIRVKISVLAPSTGTFFAGDGMAFVLQTAGTSAIGPGGNSMGYAHLYDGITCGAPYTGGIDPSVALEVDLFHNGVCIADPPGAFDHLALVENGRYDVAFPNPATSPFPGGGDVSYAGGSTPTCYTLRVQYTVGDTLNVYWDNVLRISRPNYDIVNNIFGGNNMVFWGMTAATGANASRFTICHENCDAGVDTTICENQTLQLNGVGGGTYIWSPATGLSANNVQNPVFTPPATGTFPFQLDTRTDYNCTDRDSVIVTVVPTPVFDAGTATTICSGQSVNLGGTSPDPNWTFSWSPATGLNNPSAPDPVATPTTTTTYTVTVTDTSSPAQCSITDTVTITVSTQFSIDAGPNDSVCLGDTVQIGAAPTAGLQYSWSPSASLVDPNVAQPLAFPTQTTTYVMTATDPNSGCNGIDSLTVVVNDVNVTAGGDQEICLGETGILVAQASGGSGNYSFYWIASPVMAVDSVDTPSVAPVDPTTFEVFVVDNSTGCTDSASHFMDVNELPVTLIADRDIANPGQGVQLTASGGMIYIWSDSISGLTCYDCPDPIAIAMPGMTSWTVTGVDTITGCQGTATVTVELKDYMVPNVFTPNGDGINDELQFDYYGTNLNIKEVQIYDRWGHEIFTTDNPQVMWDGTNKSGANAPEGVYYMVIIINGDPAIPADQRKIVAPVTLMR